MRSLQSLLIFFFFLIISVESLAQSSGHLDQIIESYQSNADDRNAHNNVSWTKNSPEDLAAAHLKNLNQAKQLSEIKPEELSQQRRIDHELLQLIIDDKIYRYEYGTHLFPLSAEGGFIIGMLYATRGKKLSSDADGQNYIKKLKDLKRYVDQQISWMRIGLAENKVMPKLVVNNCLEVLRNAVSDDVLFLMKPFHQSEISESLIAQAEKLKTQELIPWLKKLEKFLQDEYLPRTYEQVGISNNTDGKAFYEQRIRYFTTLDMTPQEVYDVGKREVARIRKEMEAIIAELEYDGDFASFIKFLREDPQFYAETPQELLNHAAWLSMKAQEILPRYFNKIYRLPFTVKPVPAEIAPTYTTGRYSGGSMKDGRCGQYWVNTYNLPARPLYVLPALTLHEAVPGHHLQISLAKEMEGLPKFRTTQYLSAYGEGWGLYSEYLGEEAGIYTTPYERFGRLTYEMWRACRLVVDPGMHYFGMTRDEAVRFMAENTSLSLHEVNTEIDRYIGWPGQAVSYKIGELKIRELRSRAEQALGDDFEIRDFHDLLLANGSVPLTTLERIVEEWIEGTR